MNGLGSGESVRLSEKCILLCTLGASWGVIPEVVALLDPQRVPLYRLHPRLSELEKMQIDHGLQAPDEIWVITTAGEETQRSLESLQSWNLGLNDPYTLRTWIAEGTRQLDSVNEVEAFRELTFRMVLKASEQARPLYLSLAGGRKTMSADLQKAASAFGCDQMFHVVDNGTLPDELFRPAPEYLRQPLPLQAYSEKKGGQVECSGAVMPIVMNGEPRSELLDISTDDYSPIRSKDYPVPRADGNHGAVNWSGEPRLANEFAERRREGGQMFGNYLSALARQEHHENWRMLYRLPPQRINQLGGQVVTADDREWLRRIPKADLHRHIGGCLSLNKQVEVGRAVWDAMTEGEREQALHHVQPLLNRKDWESGWPEQLRPRGSEKDVLRSHRTAALLVHAEEGQLQHNLYDVTEPRIALKDRIGFSAYELPGELTGSAILQHEAAIEPYAELLVEQARSEGVRYVELRGSPQKYLGGDGKGFLRQLHGVLKRVKDVVFRFVVIADRRQLASLQEVVGLAVEGNRDLGGFVVGLDLAGDEGFSQPDDLARDFLPAFEACLPVTIHAGEGERAENIWQAAYHLHADRVGHGLTLGDHPKLMKRFRDRNICIELCPSSNREVVGFRDPEIEASRTLKEYPLMEYWKAGVPVTLCTDNPGISSTDLANEYVVASRMVDGISHWDALAMIKQGFARSFLPADEKGEMIRDADREIYNLMQ